MGRRILGYQEWIIQIILIDCTSKLIKELPEAGI